MDYKQHCESLQNAVELLFTDLRSGISAREDSRAFGAMIETRIKESWDGVCSDLGFEPLPIPGRRTIFDFACRVEGSIYGLDVKTKDLDKTSYSDGGVCAVGNLLKFLANDKGVFLVVEFGHNASHEVKTGRDLEYIRVCPFHVLPADTYRIENLGTGQVRLNYSIHQVWEEIDWNRSTNSFFDIFTDLAIKHYERVGRDATKRAGAMKDFRETGYREFRFVR